MKHIILAIFCILSFGQLFGQNNSIALSQMRFSPNGAWQMITTNANGMQYYIPQNLLDIDTRVTNVFFNNDTLNIVTSRVSGQNQGVLDTLKTFIPIPPPGGVSINAGTGISLSGDGSPGNPFIITNTAPDLVVTLTAGSGISVSGTYPNFTVNNTSPDQIVTIAGGGINSVSGTYPNFTITATEVDGSITNEGRLSVSAGGANDALLNTNTSGSNSVMFQGGTGISITETTSTNGGTINITNSAPDQTVTITGSTGITVSGSYPNFNLTVADQSATNELQTLSISNDTLSISSGNFVVLPQPGSIDTATFLINDSILVYSVNGIEFGRDTIRVISSGGGGDTCAVKANCLPAVDLFIPDDKQALFINATLFNNGSQTCDVDQLLISIDSVNFFDEILIDCSMLDTGTQLTQFSVTMQVTDVSNNSSTCTSDLFVYKISRPKLLCKDLIIITTSPTDTILQDVIYQPGYQAIVRKDDVLHNDFFYTDCAIAQYGFVDPTIPASYDTPFDSLTFNLGSAPAPPNDAFINYTLMLLDVNDNRSYCNASVFINNPFRGDNTGGGVDTATFLQQDSILIYSVAGVEFGRDTIRVVGSGGGTDTSGYNNFFNLSGQTLSIGDFNDTLTVTLPIVGVSAGTGITVNTVSGIATVTNSAPDQIVTITGAGINSVSGTYPNFTITGTEVDGSVTNEGVLGVGAGGANTSVITSNTSGATGVTISGGTGINITETTSSNGGTITVTNAAPDQTVSLTNGGGITITGTYPNFTLTAADQSPTNELQTLSIIGDSLFISSGNGVLLPTGGGGGSGIPDTVFQVMSLINNNQTPSSNHSGTTAESGALMTYTLLPNDYDYVYIEFLTYSALDPDANLKVDFTYRLKENGSTVATFDPRIIASSSSLIDGGGRVFTHCTQILAAGSSSNVTYTVTAQHSNTNTLAISRIENMRIFGIKDVIFGSGGGAIDTIFQNQDTVFLVTGADTSFFILPPAPGDNWGTQVVERNGTLIGNGTIGNVLGVDTSVIASQFFVTSQGYTTNTGTVTSVSGTGSVNGITLSGTVTNSGSLTLGGTLSGVSLTTQVTGTLPVGNGGTGATSLTGVLIGNGTSAVTGIAGTASQLLRRNAANTAYEFFTHDFVSNTRNINTSGSLTGGGNLTADRTIQLVNDNATPGNSQYYGTNSSGTKGYFPLPTGGGPTLTAGNAITIQGDSVNLGGISNDNITIDMQDKQLLVSTSKGSNLQIIEDVALIQVYKDTAINSDQAYLLFDAFNNPYIDLSVIQGSDFTSFKVYSDSISIASNAIDIYNLPVIAPSYTASDTTILAQIGTGSYATPAWIPLPAGGGGGDNWGSQVVESDNTLTGNGTAGNLLKVDTTIIATQNYVTTRGYITGNQTITLSGDVTGSGATSITTTIANDAVTFAKMQNISTQHLIGRHSSGSGDPEQVGIDGGLEFNGANIRRSALTGDVTAAAGNNTTTIANNAVSNAKFRQSAGLSVVGRSANTTGDVADITAGGNNQFLVTRSNVLGFGSLTATDIPDLSATYYLASNPNGFTSNTGTVTSVGLSLPAIFNVTNSPVTGAGTLTATFNNQNANLVFAGPSTGGAASPTFRSLVSDDIPALDMAKITTGNLAWSRISSTPTTLSGYGITDGVTTAREVNTSGSLTGGGNLSANRTLSLVNDNAAPGNSKYYGTDGSGTKGFFDLPSGGEANTASNLGSGFRLFAQKSGVDLQFKTINGSEGIQLDSTSTEVTIKRRNVITPFDTTATAYTLQLADMDRRVFFSSGSNVTVTIPTDSSVPFPIGTVLTLYRDGAGELAIDPAGTVTLQSAQGYRRAAHRYQAVELYKIGTNEWRLIGDLKN